MFRPIFHPKTSAEGPTWQHEVANHYRDFREKVKQRRFIKKRRAGREDASKKMKPAVERDPLDIATLIFPR